MRLTVETGSAAPAAASGCLAEIGFGREHGLDPAEPRRVQVGLPPLAEPAPRELWWSERPVEIGRWGEIAYATDGRSHFGHLLLAEPAGGSLEALGRHAYEQILGWCRELGDAHLLRVWNYLADINREQAGLERYRAFCVGRHQALAAAGWPDRQLPAACAVGAPGPGLLISCLAAARPGVQVENPRQVSAFRYPPRYGPQSPSFSRAMRVAASPGQLLLISGTASIVGHVTIHPDQKAGQLTETLANLAALLQAAGGQASYQALRVYVRHPEDWPSLAPLCREAFGPAVPLVPLQGDLCRSDLVLEIDGLAALAAA